MSHLINRRDFLQVGAVFLGGLAYQPLFDFLKIQAREDPIGIGRVTIHSIPIYKNPSLTSKTIGKLYRDQLIPLLKSVISVNDPTYNPHWYQIREGYLHSAHIQRVEQANLQEPTDRIPEGGKLGEISVPFTQSLLRKPTGWEKAYRLYYQSVHWIMGIDHGPHGDPYYQLKDELLKVIYMIPAYHVRLITDEELSPLSPNVSPEKKRIEVSIAKQTLTAYEDEKIVLATTISSGMPSIVKHEDVSTETPQGSFRIDPKVPSKHMGNGQLTSEINAYELPGVPWVSFFVHDIGVAFHGTYWHDNFGARMSHGCVNMRTEEAKWLYRWSLPTAKSTDWTRMGRGTLVEVI